MLQKDNGRSRDWESRDEGQVNSGSGKLFFRHRKTLKNTTVLLWKSCTKSVLIRGDVKGGTWVIK